jgi:hypothetical protein
MVLVAEVYTGSSGISCWWQADCWTGTLWGLTISQVSVVAHEPVEPHCCYNLNTCASLVWIYICGNVFSSFEFSRNEPVFFLLGILWYVVNTIHVAVEGPWTCTWVLLVFTMFLNSVLWSCFAHCLVLRFLEVFDLMLGICIAAAFMVRIFRLRNYVIVLLTMCISALSTGGSGLTSFCFL